MITIDEAIEKYREKENLYGSCCEGCEKEHKQLAEWLEELKWYKEIELYTQAQVDLFKQEERNKAIDNFIHECDKYCGYYTGKNRNLTREDMLNIAKQLKGRMNNEFI